MVLREKKRKVPKKTLFCNPELMAPCITRISAHRGNKLSPLSLWGSLRLTYNTTIFVQLHRLCLTMTTKQSCFSFRSLSVTRLCVHWGWCRFAAVRLHSACKAPAKRLQNACLQLSTSPPPPSSHQAFASFRSALLATLQCKCCFSDINN